MPDMPKLAFAWASTWMLREIELRKMKIRDVTFPGTTSGSPFGSPRPSVIKREGAYGGQMLKSLARHCGPGLWVGKQ